MNHKESQSIYHLSPSGWSLYVTVVDRFFNSAFVPGPESGITSVGRSWSSSTYSFRWSLGDLQQPQMHSRASLSDSSGFDASAYKQYIAIHPPRKMLRCKQNDRFDWIWFWTLIFWPTNAKVNKWVSLSKIILPRNQHVDSGEVGTRTVPNRQPNNRPQLTV